MRQFVNEIILRGTISRYWPCRWSDYARTDSVLCAWCGTSRASTSSTNSDIKKLSPLATIESYTPNHLHKNIDLHSNLCAGHPKGRHEAESIYHHFDLGFADGFMATVDYEETIKWKIVIDNQLIEIRRMNEAKLISCYEQLSYCFPCYTLDATPFRKAERFNDCKLDHRSC